jgi:predicted DNA-binding transcriptional regulator YafY
MNRTDRLLAILTRLQSRHYTTVVQLAEQFAISERTVYRDLRALTEIGVPIMHEAERGYRVGAGFFLPPVSLTTAEVHALALLEPLIVRFADHSVRQHFATSLAKLAAVMNERQQRSLEQARAQAAHFIPDQYTPLLPATDYLTPLQDAIIQERVVELTYRNLGGKLSQRAVEPIGLTFYSLNWHLIAWCQLREAYRDFRVSRIQSLRATIRPFTKADHLTLNEYLQALQQTIDENSDHPLT